MSRHSIGRSLRSVAGRPLAALVLLSAVACGGTPEVPAPRPLIVHSGARLTPTHQRLEQIDAWIRPELDDIQKNPGFLIKTLVRDTTVYPWGGLSIQGDTASVAMKRGVAEAQVPYMIYAHLHLMKTMGKLDQWLPEASDSSGFGLELAILRRTADAWLYGRSAWDAPPYEALDQITYAHEDGYLQPMIFTARPDAFPDAGQAWISAHPDGLDTYRRWFRETFGKEPPGPSTSGGGGGPAADSTGTDTGGAGGGFNPGGR